MVFYTLLIYFSVGCVFGWIYRSVVYLVGYRGRLCIYFDIEVSRVFGSIQRSVVYLVRNSGRLCIWFDIEVIHVFGSIQRSVVYLVRYRGHGFRRQLICTYAAIEQVSIMCISYILSTWEATGTTSNSNVSNVIISL